MSSLAVELGALLVYAPILVLFHELGHVALARAGGYRVSSFGVGMGRPLWRLHLAHGVVLHLDTWLLAGGAAVAIPDGPAGARRAWFHGGGLLFQLALGLVLLALPEWWLVQRVAQLNLLVGITNALPWRAGALASDGWYLLDVALGGRRSSEILPQRPLFRRLARREQVIGSPLGQAWARVCLAWTDVLSGQLHRAAPLFEEDPSLTVVSPWIEAVYSHIRAEWGRQQGRAAQAVQSLRQTRLALEPHLGPAPRQMLMLAEARSLVDLQRGQEALAVLGRMGASGGMVGRQAEVVTLAAQLDGEEEVEHATWRVLRLTDQSFLDPADAALVLLRASQRLHELGRAEPARGALEAARALARRTLHTAAAEDREALGDRLGELAGDPTREA